MDQWLKVAENSNGTERNGPLKFASVRKGDKVLIVPCFVPKQNGSPYSKSNRSGNLL